MPGDDTPCLFTFVQSPATTPRRASCPATRSGQYVAETFLEDVQQRNWERGMLGFTGTFRGKPVRPVDRHGLPLGGDRGRGARHRHGHASYRRPGLALALGDLIVAISAVPADRPLPHHPRDHAPTADWGPAFGRPRGQGAGEAVRVGPIVRAVFYNSDEVQYQRYDRGVLAVEMEAAVLFTLGALRKVAAGLPHGQPSSSRAFVRITDEEMKAAVDQMTELALAVANDH